MPVSGIGIAVGDDQTEFSRTVMCTAVNGPVFDYRSADTGADDNDDTVINVCGLAKFEFRK